MGLTQKILLFASALVVALVVTSLAFTTFQANELAHFRSGRKVLRAGALPDGTDPEDPPLRERPRGGPGGHEPRLHHLPGERAGPLPIWTKSTKSRSAPRWD